MNAADWRVQELGEAVPLRHEFAVVAERGALRPACAMRFALLVLLVWWCSVFGRATSKSHLLEPGTDTTLRPEAFESFFLTPRASRPTSIA